MEQQRGWRTFAVVAVSAAAVLVLSIPDLAGATTGASSTARTANWKVTVWVARTSVKAGTTIPASITFDNRTGHAVKLGQCPGTYDLMNLGNSKIPNSIVVPTPACWSATIPVGVSVAHTKVRTNYEGCTKSTPSPDLPRCPKNGGPLALPAGTYQTNIVLPAFKGLPVPKPITIRLTA